MPSTEELLERIRQLELDNSELRDKLDMIYSIVAPEDADDADDEVGKDEVLVQIRLEKTKGVN